MNGIFLTLLVTLNAISDELGSTAIGGELKQQESGPARVIPYVYNLEKPTDHSYLANNDNIFMYDARIDLEFTIKA